MLDSLKGILVAGKVLLELLLLSIEFGDELLLLSHDVGATILDGISDDHWVLLEGPAILDIIDDVLEAELIEELVMALNLLLKLLHLELSLLL